MDSLKKLYQEHFDFLKSEFGIEINKASDLDRLTDDERDDLYMNLVDIETDECPNDRGNIATDIVTYMHKYL